jgi:uncharacterized protein YceK
MRALALVLIVVTGCSSTTKEITARQAARSAAFKRKMDTGQTTRAQEQAFIRANYRAWAAEDYVINGTPLPADVAATVSTDQPESLMDAGTVR